MNVRFSPTITSRDAVEQDRAAAHRARRERRVDRCTRDRRGAGWRPAFSSASISPCRIALPCCTRRLWPRPRIAPVVHEHRRRSECRPRRSPRSASSMAAGRNSSMAAILPHRRITMETLKLRPTSDFPRRPRGLLVVLAVAAAGQPAPAPSLTMLSRDGRRRADRDWSAIRNSSRSTISRRPFSSPCARNRWRDHGVLQGQNDCPDAGPGARVGRGPAGLAARAAVAERAALARAGRVHQPRARADLRHAARPAQAVASAGHRRPARAAHHGPLRAARRRARG